MSELTTNDYLVDELPSQGLSYPEDTKFYVRPFTYGEVLRLNEPNTREDEGEIYRILLTGIRSTGGFDTSKLTVPDFKYLSLLRKFSTFDTDISFEFTFECSKCFASQTKVLKFVDNFVFVDLSIKSLPIKLESLGDKKNLEFHPVTVGSFITAYNESKKDVTRLRVKLMASQFVSSSITQKEAEEIVTNSSGIDIDKLEKIDELLFHDVKPIVVECSKCKNKASYPIDSQGSIISPFRGGQDLTTLGIGIC